MIDTGESGATDPLRAVLRARLVSARRDRDRAVADAIRTALGAMENAEAVPAETGGGSDARGGPWADTASEHVAGAAPAGAAEVRRRDLAAEEETAILEAEVASLREAVTTYEAARRPEEAADAARAADVLSSILPGSA